MRAVVRPRYGPPEVLQLVDIARPSPADDEVLVRVHAASVGAWDWHLLAADPHFMRLSGEGFLKPKVPVAGADLAGVVEAVGTGVTGFESGDEVYGESKGAFAEYACVSSDSLGAKPTNMTFEQAAAVPIAGTTALQGLRDHGRLEAGQQVLIIGASGGVGTFAVQIAKALGADVTAVCGSGSVELVESLGADRVIDYTQERATDRPERYDVVFQLAGRESALRLRRLTVPDGTVVLSSGEGGPWIGPGLRLVTALVASPFISQRLTTFVASATTEDLATLTELIEAGQVTPVIDRTYPLVEAAVAVRHVRDGPTRGKTVLTVV